MDFPKYKMIDGNKFGPTKNKRYYQPAYYHNPVSASKGKGKKAKRQEHEVKTHWVLNQSEQYHVFVIGDENDLKDKNGIYSVLDNCKIVLGEDGQKIAIFETPRNDTWHGYPIFSYDKPIDDAIVEKMEKKGLINLTTKQRILTQSI